MSWETFEKNTPDNNEEILVFGPGVYKNFEDDYILSSGISSVELGRYCDGKNQHCDPYVAGINVIPTFWMRIPRPPHITKEEIHEMIFKMSKVKK